jgi:signal transduction histidine kinase
VSSISDDPAARQRPPLTKRLRPSHWAALDTMAGGLITVILFGTLGHSLRPNALPPFATHYAILPMTGLLAVLLAVMAGIAVALRRRRPVFMLGVLLVGSLVVTSLIGPGSRSLIYFVPISYVLYLVAATYDRRQNAVLALAAVFITLLADVALMALGLPGYVDAGAPFPILVALCVIIVWTIGYTVRQRRRYAVRLQREAASKAVAQERLRIARELHDVVAHSMSVIAVQAGYGQYVIDTQPHDARTALGAIQATSREALDEMRRMLGALRQADEGDARDDAAGSAAQAGAGRGAVRAGESAAHGSGAPLFPAPGLAGLDRLVARTAGAGVQVDVTRAGQPRDLPVSIDLSAYRIVQEALTNVVKHAQTSSCRVLIGYRDDELVIEITDNGAGLPDPEVAAGALNGSTLASRNGSPPRGVATLDRTVARPDGGLPRSVQAGRGIPGGGHGIIGMRERVTLLGGEFSAGPLPGYGFRVSANIPLPSSGT